MPPSSLDFFPMRRIFRNRIAALLLLFLSGSLPLYAAQIVALPSGTLSPVAWAFFGDGGGGPIDGGVDYTEVSTRVFVGYSSTTPEVFRGIYEFDLNAFAATTVNAQLLLRATYSLGVESVPAQLWGYIGNGSASAADFSAGSLLSDFNLAAAGLYTLDVSAFVSAAIQNGFRYVGFNIRPNGDPYANDTSYQLGTPAEGPTSTLQVAAVPEPSAAALLCLALVAGQGFSFLRALKNSTPLYRDSWPV
jgi:hypothetical protein